MRELTLLLSRASALCSSFCLKQLVHLLLLKMLGANFLHSDRMSAMDMVSLGEQAHTFTDTHG